MTGASSRRHSDASGRAQSANDDWWAEVLAIADQLDADRAFIMESRAGKLLGKRVHAGTYVPMVLVARIMQSVEAIAVLLRDGFVAEAGVVTLAAFETKLDMLYIGTDAKRGEQWLHHDDPVHQPWPVVQKLNAVYDEGSLASQHQRLVFRYLSAIKHGNPAAGPAGFPERRTSESWDVSTGGFGDEVDVSLGHAIGLLAREQLLEVGLALVLVLERMGVADICMDDYLQAGMEATQAEIRRLMAVLDPSPGAPLRM